jgi:deoxyribodipyrimidine photo-lyase
MISEYKISAVYSHKEVTGEEVPVEDSLETALWKLKVPLVYCWGSTLYHLHDLPFPVKSLPDTFAEFRKQLEREAKVRPAIPPPVHMRVPENVPDTKIPSLFQLGLDEPVADRRAVLPFKGGEKEALERLHYYIWEADLLKNYAETKNGLIGGNYSTKLAPWLANGSLSPRKVYEEIKKYEQKRVKNESTQLLIQELLWRDYLRFGAKKQANQLVSGDGVAEVRPSLAFDPELFNHWKNGTTGIPFVDANMKELRLTGFMSSRGRKAVARFLVQDLKQDWRAGVAYFESQLVDSELSANWGNWLYMAGLTQSPAAGGAFPILQQALEYDPKGDYVKLWLPALAAIPAPQVHTPYLLSTTTLALYGVVLGKDYPEPILILQNGRHAK